jgi:integrase
MNMIFTNSTGGYLSYRTVYDRFKWIAAKIDIPSARFHDLRHSYAVAASQSGDDITASFPLDVYGHVTGRMKQASADRMERFIQYISAKKHNKAKPLILNNKNPCNH